MIDQNKTAVLIDFDRMINEETKEKRENTTVDFDTVYQPKEIYEINYTNKCDIFSIRKIMQVLPSKLSFFFFL